LGNATVATINFINYGSFVLNEMKSDAFSDAFGALSKIEQKNWEPKVPVSKDAREKAYRVSPAFAVLRNELEDNNNLFLQFGEGEPNDYKGGWFMWAFRQAAENAGYHNNLPESQAFYRRITNEINSAFRSGKLNETSTVTILQYKFDQRIIKPLVVKIYEGFHFVAKYEGYNPVGEATSPDLMGLADFQKITGEPVKLDVQQNAETAITKGKYIILNKISFLYATAGPYVLALSLFAYALLTLRCITKARSKRTTTMWVILTAVAIIWVSRVALISYLSIIQWDAMTVHYLCPTYPYLLIFEFLAIYSLVDLVKKRKKTIIHTHEQLR
jgi:hypothetical protein